PLSSFDRLQVRRHGVCYTKEPPVVEELAVLHALTLAREAQCLERDVQSDFVPEFEAIHHGSRRVVDPQRYAADTMRLEAFAESLGVKAVHRDGYRQLDAV